jgi:D-threonate/D-erythronate kinase
VCELALLLEGAAIAYKKLDSLLRGPWVAEVDACLRTGLWDGCIVAPAFSYQGRCTRAGQHYARASDGCWTPVGDNIVLQLRERGLDARLANAAAELRPGINVFDAETDDDMDRIVQIGRDYQGKILWCGSGGLAGALARGTDVGPSAALKRPVLKRPVLGVFGSDHLATAAQLAHCEDIVIRTADVRASLGRIRQRLDDGVVLVKLDAPDGASRTKAARHFADEITRLCRSIAPPGTLLVAGGETLKAQCVATSATALKVLGRLEPGVPKSVVQGGSWAGVDVVSKSGAFGPADLWWKLLSQNGLI